MAPLLLALAIALASATSLAQDPRPAPLAGPWTVSVGRSATGAGAHSVELPYVVNATGFTGRRGLVSYRGSIAWFRKQFTVPADGIYVLGFGSVQHRATVWIDGGLVR